jgi:hypothetical protein
MLEDLSMNRTELARIANAMVAKNKGILAAGRKHGHHQEAF